MHKFTQTYALTYIHICKHCSKIWNLWNIKREMAGVWVLKYTQASLPDERSILSGIEVCPLLIFSCDMTQPHAFQSYHLRMRASPAQPCTLVVVKHPPDFASACMYASIRAHGANACGAQGLDYPLSNIRRRLAVVVAAPGRGRKQVAKQTGGMHISHIQSNI